MPRRTCIFLALAVVLVLPLPASAGAWTQDPGHGLLILHLGRYSATHQYDVSGRLADLGPTDSFRKIELQTYFEAGLARRVTLVGNLFIPAIRVRQGEQTRRSFGAGDAGLGVRLRVSAPSARQVWSVQAMALAPAYARRDPVPGLGRGGVEARLLTGRSMGGETRRVYWNLEVGTRWLAGIAPWAVWNGALGVTPRRRATLLAEWSSMRTLRPVRQATADLNFAGRAAFSLHQAGFSAVVQLGRHSRFQAGVWQAVAGRNTGSGRALSIAYWRDF